MSARHGRKRAERPVSRGEFEALSARFEDLEDALALRGAAAAFDEKDALPLAMVKRIQSGAHPLRIWRERRRLTLMALARSSGVRMSYLSEIEAGKKPGSVDAYRKAAAALGVEIDDLVPRAKRMR